MQELLFALLALVVGAVFCFAGYAAFRIIFPIWGFFAGFAGGAALVAGLNHTGFIATTLGWVIGLVVGLVFAVLAYFFYEVAIILFAASFGYWVGSGVLIGLGLKPGVITFLVGAAVAIAISVYAILYNLPKFLLMFFTAFGGAVIAAGGIMLLINRIELDAFRQGAVTAVIHGSVFWTITVLVVGVVGFVTQWQLSHDYDRQVREYWETN